MVKLSVQERRGVRVGRESCYEINRNEKLKIRFLPEINKIEAKKEAKPFCLEKCNRDCHVFSVFPFYDTDHTPA